MRLEIEDLSIFGLRSFLVSSVSVVFGIFGKKCFWICSACLKNALIESTIYCLAYSALRNAESLNLNQICQGGIAINL